MIEKNKDFEYIKTLYNEYKNDEPIISEYTKIYTYNINNEIVSFIIFDIIYDRCEINHIYTKENYRQKGYAYNLILEIEKDFKIDNITLEVNKNNENAVKLYEKVGFELASIRKGYYNGEDAILMIKEVR